MLAPLPRAEGIEYRDVCGHLLFDCAGLKASLSPASCADNFTQRRCFACTDCEIGQIHAGKATQTQPDASHRPCVCTRCGKKDTRRQVGGVLCMSCYNREREVLRGRNGKGCFPRVVAAHLHRCTATLAGDDLLEKFQLPGQHLPPASPSIIQIAPGQYLLDAIVTGTDELSRLLARRLPGAHIREAHIGPSFLECRQS